MKRKSITIIVSILSIFLIIILVINLTKKEEKQDTKFNILTSFYPVYVMTLNIVDGANNINLNNMAESHTGCIHDYTLNTTDLRKFENADVFIQNGKNLENFTENITSLYPNVKIIESAEDVENNYIKQVEKITEKLKTINPENSKIYERNSIEYIQKLNNLKQEFEKINVQNKKAIC